ncbi:hypothetical protein [Humisphaera borealis]|uniref:DUF2029 domain-containing protein n=1 Tax=Humisphaera borealis TaxID=2807512 RepID=A0A7M2X2C7_9BACT|nr:hypothetical protein [Humisphaera borealis]QOV91824.1 hypothetical protein IPV69_10910 [Humisphaera borealis]
MSGDRKRSPAEAVKASPKAPTSSPASATVRQALFAGVCVLVGVAVRIADGNYHPAAIGLIVVAALISLVAVGNPRGIAERRLSSRSFAMVLVCGIVVQAVALLAAPMFRAGGGIDPDALSAALGGVIGIVAGVLICGIAAIRQSPSQWPVVVGVAVMLVSHLVSGASIVRSAVPPMDVIVFQDQAAQMLIDGGNPYAMTYPDLSGGMSPHYGPGLQADGKLLFGFPYPPLSLFAVVPATLLLGDFRYSHALCVTLIGAVIALTRRSPASGLAAGLFLLTPIGPLVIVNGWTEPLVALLLATTVCVAARRPTLTGVPLGLFWAVKQYVPLTAPLMLLLPRGRTGRATNEDPDRSRLAVAPQVHSSDVRSEEECTFGATANRGESGSSQAGSDTGFSRTKLLVTSLIVSAVVTLPLVLMDIPAFWHSAVALQLQQPFRDDALSLQTLWYRLTGAIPPGWPAFLALAGVQALAIWRMPRSAASFAGATGAALLIFFALSKQAFANYYFLAAAAAAIAAALDTGSSEPDVV